MRVMCACVALLAAVMWDWSPVAASSPIGVYAIIEKVVLEPDATNPERAQVWGAFTFIDQTGSVTSQAARGYLYFRLPWEAAAADQVRLVRREWADLAHVAGTGQAIGFGTWRYIGQMDANETAASQSSLFLRVHLSSETPRDPIVYRTETGIVTLASDGSHAEVVRRLRELVRN